MKTKNILVIVAVVVAVVSILYSFVGSQDQAAYTTEIDKDREEKDRFMRTSPESPFAGKVDTYQGLKYFPAQQRYKITADLTPITDKKMVMLATSDGKTQQYMTYAYADFDLDSHRNRLLILEVADAGPFRGKLFLAFGDETSAGDTYGAGRYLDITKVQGSNTITLDFNKAYNPYCAYNDKFSCPFPPEENLLQVAIRAGEMTYHH